MPRRRTRCPWIARRSSSDSSRPRCGAPPPAHAFAACAHARASHLDSLACPLAPTPAAPSPAAPRPSPRSPLPLLPSARSAIPARAAIARRRPPGPGTQRNAAAARMPARRWRRKRGGGHDSTKRRAFFGLLPWCPGGGWPRQRGIHCAFPVFINHERFFAVLYGGSRLLWRAGCVLDRAGEGACKQCGGADTRVACFPGRGGRLGPAGREEWTPVRLYADSERLGNCRQVLSGQTTLGRW